MNSRRRPKVNIAKDAAHPPEILVLKVGAVAPPKVLHGEQVFARLEELGDVEFDGGAAVFPQADLLAVDPKVKEGVDAVERDEHAPASPLSRDREGTAVRIDGVVRVVDRDERRAPWLPPGIADIHIDGDAIPVLLNVRWNGNGSPRGIIEVRFRKPGNSVVHRLRIAILPLAIERPVKGRFDAFAIRGVIDLQRRGRVRADDHRSMGRLMVESSKLRVLPVEGWHGIIRGEGCRDPSRTTASANRPALLAFFGVLNTALFVNN